MNMFKKALLTGLLIAAGMNQLMVGANPQPQLNAAQQKAQDEALKKPITLEDVAQLGLQLKTLPPLLWSALVAIGVPNEPNVDKWVIQLLARLGTLLNDFPALKKEITQLATDLKSFPMLVKCANQPNSAYEKNPKVKAGCEPIGAPNQAAAELKALELFTRLFQAINKISKYLMTAVEMAQQPQINEEIKKEFFDRLVVFTGGLEDLLEEKKKEMAAKK